MKNSTFFQIKAKFFRGLSDSTRLTILEVLVEGEKSVGEIVHQIQQSQSNTSNHLKCLYECGLIKKRKQGKRVYYSINEGTREILNISEKVLSEVYSNIANCVNYKEE